MKKLHHPFHMVSVSPWPILISLCIFNNLALSTLWMHKMESNPLISIPPTLMCMYLWWKDVIREATFSGSHSKYVIKNMRLGMILFIISEVFFFISFFWMYFHSSLSPSIQLGQAWPPFGISPFNPFNIPLLNTIILISSGLSITWSHHSILNNEMSQSKNALIITIILGGYFSIIQAMEYKESPFTLADSIYGSSFFIATGFHGIHVLIGTMFLVISLKRLTLMHFSKIHHFGFEAAAWYWHFVDVVWLFLYFSIYWWSF